MTSCEICSGELSVSAQHVQPPSNHKWERRFDLVSPAALISSAPAIWPSPPRSRTYCQRPSPPGSTLRFPPSAMLGTAIVGPAILLLASQGRFLVWCEKGMPLRIRPFLTQEFGRQCPFNVPWITELRDVHALRQGGFVVERLMGEFIVMIKPISVV